MKVANILLGIFADFLKVYFYLLGFYIIAPKGEKKREKSDVNELCLLLVHGRAPNAPSIFRTQYRLSKPGLFLSVQFSCLFFFFSW